ncbi:MAG TPA: hypothetical protein VK061_01045 [Bacillota bacterium]|nr:hypothetical protein [Bacillota bacterium]
MAETTFLTVLMLLIIGSLKYYANLPFDPELLLLLGPFIMNGYTYVRYILSGIEYTNVSNEREYKEQRKKVVIRSLVIGVVFFLILLLFKGILTKLEETIELIVLPILFIIFFILFNFFSLKRSMKKNQDVE